MVRDSIWDVADRIIEEAYPNFYKLEKGMWGHQRIPNYGILRHAIAKVISDERKGDEMGVPSEKVIKNVLKAWDEVSIDYQAAITTLKYDGYSDEAQESQDILDDMEIAIEDLKGLLK